MGTDEDNSQNSKRRKIIPRKIYDTSEPSSDEDLNCIPGPPHIKYNDITIADTHHILEEVTVNVTGTHKKK